MPRAEDAATESATLPGVYRALLEREQRHHDRADPRLWLELDPAAMAEANARAAAEPPTGALAHLLTGKPMTVPAWMLRGGTFRSQTASWPWLLDCDWVEIDSDDTVIPAEDGTK